MVNDLYKFRSLGPAPPRESLKWNLADQRALRDTRQKQVDDARRRATEANSSAKPHVSNAKPRLAAPIPLKLRSEMSRVIALQLSMNPDARDREICRALDADGGIELPAAWKCNPKERLFEDVYRDTGRRNKIQSKISKVRASMRKKGLL